MKLRVGTYRLRAALLKETAPRSGSLARILRHPNPLEAPWRQRVVNASRAGAMGDVLMCTPALREVKRKNPAGHVRFFTNFPSLVRDLPYIDEVRPFEERPKTATYLAYEDTIPPHAPIASIIGDKLGVKIRDIRPDCVIEAALAEKFAPLWRDGPNPRIVVNRRAGTWTPNKNWPDSYWDELIDRLARVATVIEIGMDRPANCDTRARHHVDLRGQTSLDECVAVVAAADLHVGPPSGPVHVAAAARKPSVVIYGGYEHPLCTPYPENEPLYNPVDCAPCWLREPCPFDRKCLSGITPDAVEAAVWRVWARSGGLPRDFTAAAD